GPRWAAAAAAAPSAVPPGPRPGASDRPASRERTPDGSLRAMPYVHEVEVLPADIDRLQHASNQVYLRWVLEAALAHSTALGLDEEAYFRLVQAWVVRRHELSYLTPTFAGDRL